MGQRASREETCGLKAAGTHGKGDHWAEEMVSPGPEMRAKASSVAEHRLRQVPKGSRCRKHTKAILIGPLEDSEAAAEV